MTVLFGEKGYQMSRKAFKKLLAVVKKSVKSGVYCIEKADTAMMLKSEPLAKVKLYNDLGHKVHSNGRV